MPAYAGIPVTLRHSSTSFTVVTGHEDPARPEGSVDWEAVDDVIYGNANQAGEDNRNVARMAAILADLPFEVSAVTGQGLDELLGADGQIVGPGRGRHQQQRRRQGRQNAAPAEPGNGKQSHGHGVKRLPISTWTGCITPGQA